MFSQFIKISNDIYTLVSLDVYLACDIVHIYIHTPIFNGTRDDDFMNFSLIKLQLSRDGLLHDY